MPSDSDDCVAVFAAFAAKAAPRTETVYVGIDPGAEGAFGLLCGGLYACADIPVVRVARSGKTKAGNARTTGAYDHTEIVRAFKKLNPLKDRVVAALEVAQVQVRGKGTGAYGGYRVGIAYGMWPLFLVQKGYRLVETPPAVWKKAMRLSSGGAPADKNKSRLMALKLWPNADLHRAKDHDRAEAMLLAEYARRTMEGGPKKGRRA